MQKAWYIVHPTTYEYYTTQAEWSRDRDEALVFLSYAEAVDTADELDALTQEFEYRRRA